LQASASQADDGSICVTIVSLSPHTAQDICCRLPGITASAVKARVLTGEMGDHNDFDAPDRVKPQSFDKTEVSGDEIIIRIPPCAVMEIAIKTS